MRKKRGGCNSSRTEVAAKTIDKIVKDIIVDVVKNKIKDSIKNSIMEILDLPKETRSVKTIEDFIIDASSDDIKSEIKETSDLQNVQKEPEKIENLIIEKIEDINKDIEKIKEKLDELSNQNGKEQNDPDFPYLKVIAPHINQNLTGDKDFLIEWESLNVPFVYIKYSSNGGKSWKFITRSTESEDFPPPNSFEWRVPNIESKNCLIKIGIFYIYDESDKFNIVKKTMHDTTT